MPNKPMGVKIESDGRDIFVVVDGIKIARRGYPDTPEAGTWVTLVEGWTVTSDDDHDTIEIQHDGRHIH
jgi:hypothetical protein